MAYLQQSQGLGDIGDSCAVIKVGYVKNDGATDPDRVVDVTGCSAPTYRKVKESTVFRDPTEPFQAPFVLESAQLTFHGTFGLLRVCL